MCCRCTSCPDLANGLLASCPALRRPPRLGASPKVGLLISWTGWIGINLHEASGPHWPRAACDLHGMEQLEHSTTLTIHCSLAVLQGPGRWVS